MILIPQTDLKGGLWLLISTKQRILESSRHQLFWVMEDLAMDETTKKIIKYASYGFIQGMTIGLTSAFCWHRYMKRLPNELLAEIKKLFLREGRIEGSWIESSPRITTWQDEHRLVFVGGITRRENEQLVQYQFMFDARSKELLELEKVE